MTGSVLQFSDSTVDSITSLDNGDVMVRFDRAYLVKSEGIPYADASTLWTQVVELIVEEGEISGDIPDMPQVLETGSIEYNGYRFMDMAQMPLQAEGYAAVELKFSKAGQVLSIRGSGARLVLEATAKYVRHMEVPA